ncbi:MAG: cytidine deaminase [Candidatus Marinimicrobia bacterium]|jgi:cytidine deaminase|nr:cytidine deaminase [Candidatus Neomarinimicrobiota bacterium]MBT3617425.1 cytidine deaminase [Candidatus Neomarinimicrobiota bacterium]MBT3829365.1 cytidine deaminase [Candidatus Neomarinimicrobiota bacterium]MBT3997648.1 cytidine deaminase [Candidatus Neomarinimicrobiota bacterium]MBT4280946.1 cytidine deaminase [Candidatus Neomarinimicrobiota bacterium]
MHKLIQSAIEVRKNSHAPYSQFKVGAAVQTSSGEIISGCNVESSSYGLTNCAERTALFRAISEGYKSFIAIAVVSNLGAPPCGACRQVIWDLCGDIPVHIAKLDGSVITKNSSDLLPDAFDGGNLP